MAPHGGHGAAGPYDLLLFLGPCYGTCSMDIHYVLWPENMFFGHGTCSMTISDGPKISLLQKNKLSRYKGCLFVLNVWL